MKLRTALVLLGVLVGLPAAGSAQAAELRPAPSVLFRAESVRTLETDSLNLAPTHWKEGVLLGGGLGIVFGGLYAYAWCNYDGADDNCPLRVLGGAFWGGLILGSVGAFVGGQFSKSQ